MNNKRLFAFVLASLILSSLFTLGLVNFVGAQDNPLPDTDVPEDTDDNTPRQPSEAENNAYDKVVSFIELPGVKQVVGIFFGIWGKEQLDEQINEALEDNEFEISPIGMIIILIVSWVIFFFFFKSLADITMPFGEGLIWVVAIGMVIIASQLRWILLFSAKLFTLAAGLGAYAIWLEVVVLIILAFGAILGSQTVAKIALRRRMAKEAMKGYKGAKEVSEAISELKEVHDSFK